jgi:hypothetical protein
VHVGSVGLHQGEGNHEEEESRGPAVCQLAAGLQDFEEELHAH